MRNPDRFDDVQGISPQNLNDEEHGNGAAGRSADLKGVTRRHRYPTLCRTNQAKRRNAHTVYDWLMIRFSNPTGIACQKYTRPELPSISRLTRIESPLCSMFVMLENAPRCTPCDLIAC